MDPNKPIDFFEYMRSSIHAKKIETDDYMLVDYRCWESGKNKLWFKENHFVFILSGDKKWVIEGEEYHAFKDDILFVKQGFGEVYHSNDQEFCVLILFIPHDIITKITIGEDAMVFNNELGDLEPITKLESNIILQGFRNSLISYLTDNSLDHTEIARIKINELLQYVFSQKNFNNIARYLYQLNNNETAHLKAIIDKHYHHALGLSEYAQMCNMSLSTFKRKFKQVYNDAPGTWLANKRLNLASKLLKTTDKTIAEIADECGFNSHSYFVKAFRQQYNNTPLKFRDGE